jgi:hypothetical protein
MIPSRDIGIDVKRVFTIDSGGIFPVFSLKIFMSPFGFSIPLIIDKEKNGGFVVLKLVSHSYNSDSFISDVSYVISYGNHLWKRMPLSADSADVDESSVLIPVVLQSSESEPLSSKISISVISLSGENKLETFLPLNCIKKEGSCVTENFSLGKFVL